MKKNDIKTNRKTTLYEWCIENKCTDILERWDYDKNVKNPYEIVNLWSGKYSFKCQNGKHESEEYSICNIIRTGRVPSCTKCNSFGMWCEENNRSDLLKRWDYNKNVISPYEISICTTKKMYFKCPRGIHESELKDINNIRKQYGSGLCSRCQSIGQYGIDNINNDFISKYWSIKNTVDPFDVNMRSQKKIWIKCQEHDYHPDYYVSASNFHKGTRCPYCSGHKVAYQDSVGYRYPKIIDIWHEKKKSPFDYLPKSNKSVYLKCDKHGLYKQKIVDCIKGDCNCPICNKEKIESILQNKVRLFIEELYDNVLHEYKCNIIPINPDTNRKLPYDNEITQKRLIIEVNGEQHYKASSFFYGKDKEKAKEKLAYRQKIDEYKKQYALSQGYNYLVIPYWTDDKNETWKKLIINKIKSIA